ncbi:MAG: HAD-IA family hydrolase [Armatimonadetes bacterium]|nr:HAD-IA family hydrolase [Armatimonadota bacterium]
MLELHLRAFKAVLFDVDGTLVNSRQRILLGLAEGIQNISGYVPSQEEVRRLIGMSLVDQMRMYAPHATEQELEGYVRFTLQRYDFHAAHDEFFTDALQTLQLCADHNLKTALVTSKNQDEMVVFLNDFPLRNRLSAVVSASDVPRPKPAADPVLEACLRLSVKPSEALMIGDSVFDVLSAKSAGAASVAVTYGFSDRDTLAGASPDLILETPEELLSWAQESLKPHATQETRFNT